MQPGLVILLLVLLVGGAAASSVGLLGLLGRLKPNRWAGIRTGFTMASDEHWYAAHRAAGPIMLLGSLPVAAASLAFLPFVLLDKIDGAIIIGLAAGSALLILTTTLVGAWYGIALAKAK
ncbi:MAG: SdpI family protein [Dehalococcoidia bacterium]